MLRTHRDSSQPSTPISDFPARPSTALHPDYRGLEFAADNERDVSSSADSCWRPPSSLADTPTAAIVGVVTDQNGGSLSTATVQAKNLDTGITTSTLTNDTGAYRLPALTPGTYDVTASSPQFKTMKRTAVHLDVGQEARLDFALAVGDVSETVVVSATPAAVDTETPAQSSIVNQQAVQNLPLNGRQLQNLALTTPGVAAGWNWSDAANRYGKARENLEGAFVVNGARGRSNDFILDGMPMNLRQYGVINFEPSVEAVEEFRLIASVPPAEFGRTMGSTVNIVTRSGGDRFHGALYEFLRNDKLDANDTFSNRAGLDRGKLRQNQFGGSLGGPIYGNRHFFFVNTELLRNIAGVETRLTSVPTADERAGRIRYTAADGTSQILDLSSSITPVSKRLLEFYPAAERQRTRRPQLQRVPHHRAQRLSISRAHRSLLRPEGYRLHSHFLESERSDLRREPLRRPLHSRILSAESRAHHQRHPRLLAHVRARYDQRSPHRRKSLQQSAGERRHHYGRFHRAAERQWHRQRHSIHPVQRRTARESRRPAVVQPRSERIDGGRAPTRSAICAARTA